MACADVPDESPGAFGGGTERTGVVVIRIWLEGGDARRGLRARISLVPDIERREEESLAAGSTEEILETVRRFVHEFVG